MPTRNNHFFFSYFGNKRQEIDNIFSCITNYEVKYIVEPYCGSCSFSYHMSLLHPQKYVYILNDNDKLLIELCNIVKDKQKLLDFEEKVNKICSSIDKNIYNTMDKTTLEAYYIRNKIHTLRPGLWKNGYKYKEIKIRDTPFCNFILNEKVIFSSNDGISVYEEYKNKNSIIFLDPPYLLAYNDFYSKPNVNIYQHLYLNKIENESSFIMLCLEWSWIIRLLFQNNKFITYDKKYSSQNKKKTIHAVITNK